MKFVLAIYGTRGDVEPCAAVGRELQRRGHDVRMAVPPDLVGFTEAAGLTTVAYGLDTQAQVDAFHDFLVREKITVLDAPAVYPQYGENYYAVFFADPEGMKLELVHYPWGYWRRVQTEGRDLRARYETK